MGSPPINATTVDGWPGLEKINIRRHEASQREYHCGTSRESIERRRVPQVRFLNLGLGVDVCFRRDSGVGGTVALLEYPGNFLFIR